MIDLLAADWGAYGALFLSAFLAATVLPAASEAVLVGLLIADQRPVAGLLAAASVGNVLGSVVNWSLGRGIAQWQHKSWFPASRAKLERGQAWYRRHGKWSLLLSWVPVIGDPLTIVAGIMREPFLTFLLLVTVAKVGRYVLLALVTVGLT